MVWLEREPQNPYDPNAIIVKVAHGQIGYVPRAVAARLCADGRIPDSGHIFALFGGTPGKPTYGAIIEIE